MIALNEIAENWKLEAKQENSIRYFYHTNEANALISGSKFFVIGRKGTGKSAVSSYLLSLSENAPEDSYNIFSEPLSFNFTD